MEKSIWPSSTKINIFWNNLVLRRRYINQIMHTVSNLPILISDYAEAAVQLKHSPQCKPLYVRKAVKKEENGHVQRTEEVAKARGVCV